MAENIKVLRTIEDRIDSLDEEIQKMGETVPRRVIELVSDLRSLLIEYRTTVRSDEQRAELLDKIRSSFEGMPLIEAAQIASGLYTRAFFEGDGDVLFGQQLSTWLCDKFANQPTANIDLWRQFK
jgi:hypothetical protein